MPRRVAGSADDLEVVEEKFPVTDSLRRGDWSGHSFAEETLEKHENARLRDLIT